MVRLLTVSAMLVVGDRRVGRRHEDADGGQEAGFTLRARDLVAAHEARGA
jgi:hypothetical protein